MFIKVIAYPRAQSSLSTLGKPSHNELRFVSPQSSHLPSIFQRGILHNERYFPDPHVFNPDRFLSGSEKEDGEAPSPIDPWTVGFGYGRRICLGIPLAQSELWIAIAMILSTFTIGFKLDPETDRPVIPEVAWIGNGAR